MSVCCVYDLYGIYSIHVTVDEKITFSARRDGGVEQLEVKGTMMVLATQPESARVSLALAKNSGKNVTYQTHPNVDKKAFRGDVIQLKNTDKPFPLNSAVGVLKWRFASSDESDAPLQRECAHGRLHWRL